MLLASQNGASGLPCSRDLPGCKLPWHFLSLQRTGAGTPAWHKSGWAIDKNLRGPRKFLGVERRPAPYGQCRAPPLPCVCGLAALSTVHALGMSHGLLACLAGGGGFLWPAGTLFS